MNKVEFDVLKSYLVESKSHRYIQENILHIDAPARGGGFETMKILHSFDVRKEHKGLLSGYDVTEKNIIALLNELHNQLDEVNPDVTYIEGATQVKLINSYERNPEARKKCIAIFGAVCQACDFDFYHTYGEAAQGYIEVHHIVPISSLKQGYKVNPKTDLVPLCSNCHSVAHKKNPPYSVAEIKHMIAS